VNSVRTALRDDELRRDTYDRLVCGQCGQALKTENDPDRLETVRFCPECAGEWKEIR
jgi:ribosomal protein S27AE